MNKRNVCFGITSLLITWLSVEALCGIGLYVLGARGLIYSNPRNFTLSEEQRSLIHTLIEGTSYTIHDAELGWTIHPSVSFDLFRSNALGIRATHEYSVEPRPGIFRVSAYGDSYTHGNDVGNDFAWTEQLERRDPKLEVLNFGVSGYGIDQAYLRYHRDGTRFRPNVVLIGYLTDNIVRQVSVFRGFMYGGEGRPLAKPRFLLQSGNLVLKSNPLPSLADYARLLSDEPSVLPRLRESDYHFSLAQTGPALDFLPSVRLGAVTRSLLSGGPGGLLLDGQYNRATEAYQVTLKLLQKFADEARAGGSRPIVLLFPTPLDLDLHRAGKPELYGDLKADLNLSGIETVDVLDAFDRLAPGAGSKDLYGSHYHFNERGNRLVAEYLYSTVLLKGLPASRLGTR